MRTAHRVGSALSAMYFLAAVLMAIAGIVIAGLMFVPPDFLDPRGEVWVPATNAAPSIAAPASAADPAEDEALHMH